MIVDLRPKIGLLIKDWKERPFATSDDKPPYYWVSGAFEDRKGLCTLIGLRQTTLNTDLTRHEADGSVSPTLSYFLGSTKVLYRHDLSRAPFRASPQSAEAKVYENVLREWLVDVSRRRRTALRLQTRLANFPTDLIDREIEPQLEFPENIMRLSTSSSGKLGSVNVSVALNLERLHTIEKLMNQRDGRVRPSIPIQLKRADLKLLFFPGTHSPASKRHWTREHGFGSNARIRALAIEHSKPGKTFLKWQLTTSADEIGRTQSPFFLAEIEELSPGDLIIGVLSAPYRAMTANFGTVEAQREQDVHDLKKKFIALGEVPLAWNVLMVEEAR